MRLGPFLVIPVAAALLVSGCGSGSGGGSTSATETWADGVCTSLNTWESAVTSAGDSLQGGNLSEDSVQSAVNDVKSATTTLSSDLEGLGKPDTESGQQAQQALTKLSTQLDQDVQQIDQAVGGASGPAATIGIATSIAASLTTMAGQVSSAFSTLENLDAKGELSSAFQQSDACKQLSSSGT